MLFYDAFLWGNFPVFFKAISVTHAAAIRSRLILKHSITLREGRHGAQKQQAKHKTEAEALFHFHIQFSLSFFTTPSFVCII